MWTDDWVGKPYLRLGRGPGAYDCLGLFLALQRERMGRVLPDPGCTMEQAIRQDALGAHSGGWRKVTDTIEGDALLFRVKGRPLHLGYALDARLMLHTEYEGVGSVIEPFRSLEWKHKLVGAYRFDA